jgi:hypothetical protein
MQIKDLTGYNMTEKNQLDNFIKHSYSFAMTIFHKITKSAKLVILLIIPTYAKVSGYYKGLIL